MGKIRRSPPLGENLSPLKNTHQNKYCAIFQVMTVTSRARRGVRRPRTTASEPTKYDVVFRTNQRAQSRHIKSFLTAAPRLPLTVRSSRWRDRFGRGWREGRLSSCSVLATPWCSWKLLLLLHCRGGYSPPFDQRNMVQRSSRSRAATCSDSQRCCS